MAGVLDRLFDRFEAHTTALLAASAIGVYLLVVVGATTSLLEAGGACSSWPTCNGGLLPSNDPLAIIAWGHRAVGLLVGLLLIVTVGTTWVHSTRRVRTVVTAAAVLYPVQTVFGATMALYGVTQTIAAIHLTVAISIFTGILLGLLWHLETVHPETAGAVGSGSSDTHQPTADGLPPEEGTPDVSALDLGKAYLQLTKPRLWWLLALVAVAAMALAAGPSLSLWNVVATVTGGILAIGASGTYNNLFERERDKQMERTADRPLLNGTIRPWQAWVFAVALTVASIAVFVVFVNVLAAALGFLAILYYSIVYTLVLKPHTDQNIVIGGAVGGFPALIGWAAVTNTVELPAVVLGAIVFLWTPAHFYNLALAYKEDYARADFPMLPIVRSEALTRRHILLYLGATMAAAVTLGMTEPLSWLYAGSISLFGGVFLWAVIRLFQERTDAAAFRTFHAANAYLGVLLAAIVFDALVFP